jgi:peptidoglycan/LPS O-acetylase OafA/YrhL
MAASRPARPRTRLDGLTGLRFWFAFLVVCHHSLEHWFGSGVYPLADFGYIGVDFFFVLSGFVLTWSWRPELSARRFWWNRVARIWPLHLATFALAIGFVATEVSRPGVVGTVANLFLVQAWFPQRPIYFGYNAVAWSLSVEVFFYLCFPVVVRLLARLSARGRAAMLAGVVVALVTYPGLFSLTMAPHDQGGWEWTTYVLPLWRLGEFVVGILVALAMRDGWRPRVPAGIALGGAVGLAAAFVGWGMHVGHLPNRPFTEIAGMLVVGGVIAAVAASELDGRRGRLTSPLMVRLGAASYALYLVHALLYGWLVGHWPGVGDGAARFAGWAAYVVAALAAAFLLHHVVEVPCERWLRKVASRRGGRVTAAERSAEVYPAEARPTDAEPVRAEHVFRSR